MRNTLRRIAFSLVTAAIAVQSPALAEWHKLVGYHQGSQIQIECPAQYECSIALEKGEKVNDGFSSDLSNWEPHIAYTGENDAQPFLILRPSRAGLRANFVMTTSRRAYYFLLTSDNDSDPKYYWMTYPDEARAFHAAVAARRRREIAARAQAAESTPDSARCTDDKYAMDRPDVPWRPIRVCNDGRHTFILLQNFKSTPSDLPILYVVDSSGQNTLANYTYDAGKSRYLVDGVPDKMILMAGSPRKKITLRVERYTPPIVDSTKHAKHRR